MEIRGRRPIEVWIAEVGVAVEASEQTQDAESPNSPRSGDEGEVPEPDRGDGETVPERDWGRHGIVRMRPLGPMRGWSAGGRVPFQVTLCQTHEYA